ncbi:hypothetical protein GIB67_033458 [Kingdonia uniflora]|uniref:Uncharacterized protein n=1 Tax=Kingdonia uniflora TaxID=39325 RepID=A0A7J7LU29_9MAGN|nr:hypothetical protein GIB67_033458 [Kingdonia uniflora]
MAGQEGSGNIVNTDLRPLVDLTSIPPPPLKGSGVQQKFCRIKKTPGIFSLFFRGIKKVGKGGKLSSMAVTDIAEQHKRSEGIPQEIKKTVSQKWKHHEIEAIYAGEGVYRVLKKRNQEYLEFSQKYEAQIAQIKEVSDQLDKEKERTSEETYCHFDLTEVDISLGLEGKYRDIIFPSDVEDEKIDDNTAPLNASPSKNEQAQEAVAGLTSPHKVTKEITLRKKGEEKLKALEVMQKKMRRRLHGAHIQLKEHLYPTRAKVAAHTDHDRYIEVVIGFYGGELERVENKFRKYVMDCEKDFDIENEKAENMQFTKDEDEKGAERLPPRLAQNFSKEDEEEIELEEVQSQCEALFILNERFNVDLNQSSEALKNATELNVKMELRMIEGQGMVSHLAEQMVIKEAELASVQEKVEELNEETTLAIDRYSNLEKLLKEAKATIVELVVPDKDKLDAQSGFDASALHIHYGDKSLEGDFHNSGNKGSRGEDIREYWFYEYCGVGHPIVKEALKIMSYPCLKAWEKGNRNKINNQAANLFTIARYLIDHRTIELIN